MAAVSSGSARRGAYPVTEARSVLWPVSCTELIAGRVSSNSSRYSARLLHVGPGPEAVPPPGSGYVIDDQSPLSRASPKRGAQLPPQLPFISVVMPCEILDGASGSIRRYVSLCACTSMNPGVTRQPSASMEGASPKAPAGSRPGTIRDILPSSTTTSAGIARSSRTAVPLRMVKTSLRTDSMRALIFPALPFSPARPAPAFPPASFRGADRPSRREAPPPGAGRRRSRPA